MRQTTPFLWEINETGAEEWEELTVAPPDSPEPPAPGRHGAAWAIMAGVLGLLTLVLGVRLWQEAEKGAARVERDIGEVVQLEAVQARLQELSAIDEAAVETIELNFAGAMARVVVTSTTPRGEIVTYTETRFYQRQGARWERCAPLPSFWGKAATLDTATLHFLYFVRDQPFVETHALALDAYHQTLRARLGLPRLDADSRIPITIVPRTVPPRAAGRHDLIVQSSPLLYRTTGANTGEVIAKEILQLLLLRRTLDEAAAAELIPPPWAPTIDRLRVWSIDRAGSLPTFVTSDGVALAPRPHPGASYSLASLQTGEVTDSAPGYAEYRIAILDAATYAFFDFTVFRAGIEGTSALLAAFKTCDNWQEAATIALGLSEEEVEAAWEAYLHAPPSVFPASAQMGPPQ
jgi:hypothetical protein